VDEPDSELGEVEARHGLKVASLADADNCDIVEAVVAMNVAHQNCPRPEILTSGRGKRISKDLRIMIFSCCKGYFDPSQLTT
jgi:hypothetical protein